MTIQSINWIGALAALAAAGLWFWASLIEVPNNQDTFIEQLQRISRLNAYAAAAAGVAAICAALALVRAFQ
jgi:hypothetical protein